QGRLVEAEAVCRECLAIRERNFPDAWQTFSTRCLLGANLLAEKKYAEAGPLLLSGYEGMKQREERISPANKGRVKEAIQWLVEYYQATGQPDGAAEWQKALTQINQQRQ